MASGYHLALDVGATRTAAALARRLGDGTLQVCATPLDERVACPPSSAFVDEDGQVLVGEDAALAGRDRPARLVEGFLERIGDGVPHLVGGRLLAAHELYARLVAAGVAHVTQREAQAPASISLAHPADWAGHRLALLQEALTERGLPPVTWVPEPVAAVAEQASVEDIPDGTLVAVHDLGGRGLRCALVEARASGTPALVGAGRRARDVGGRAVDDALLAHVLAAAGDADAAATDRGTLVALRQACVAAKESLSLETVAHLPLPAGGDLRITRPEFEALIADIVDRSAATLASLLATVPPGRDAPRILAVGGSAAIPRVTQTLSETFERPVDVGADPATCVARGAARLAAASAGEPSAAAALLDDAADAPAASRSFVAALSGDREGRRWPRWVPGALVALGGITLGGLLAGAPLALDPTGLGSAPAALAGVPLTGGAPAGTASPDPAASGDPADEPTVTPTASPPLPEPSAASAPVRSSGRNTSLAMQLDESPVPSATSAAAASSPTTAGSTQSPVSTSPATTTPATSTAPVTAPPATTVPPTTAPPATVPPTPTPPTSDPVTTPPQPDPEPEPTQPTSAPETTAAVDPSPTVDPDPTPDPAPTASDSAPDPSATPLT